MLLGDAADARRGVVPPLLIEQKTLVEQRIGPAPPRFAGKSLVLRQRLDAGRGVRLQRAARGVIGETLSFAHRLFGKLHLLSWR